MKHPAHAQNGTTLIEIMIAAAVLGLVMTSIVAIITLSIKDVAEAKARSVAIKYAQEGVELYRRQRNVMGWEAFVQTVVADGASPNNPLSYCLATVPTTTPAFEALGSSECSMQNASQYVDSRGMFQRQVDVTLNAAATELQVLSTVSWEEGSNPKQSTVAEKFQKSGGW